MEEKSTWLEDAQRSLRMRLAEIYAEACLVAGKHQDTVKTEQAKHVVGWQGVSTLNILTDAKDHPSGGASSVQMKWVSVSFYGPKTARKRVISNIKKEKGKNKYTPAELRKHSQEWEFPIVLETEEQLAKLRHEAMLIGKAQKLLYYAVAAKGKYEDAALDDEMH